MPDYLIVRAAGKELDVPYGWLNPNAPVEVDIRNGCNSMHAGIYVITTPLGEFRPAYDVLGEMNGCELDLGDLPHVSVVEPKTSIKTPPDHLIDMFLGHIRDGEPLLDSVRLITSKQELPNRYSREDFQVRLLIDSQLTPEQIRGIKARVFSGEYKHGCKHGWSKVRIRGLEIGGFKVGKCPSLEISHGAQYIQYIGPNGEEGYEEVVPNLREFLQTLAAQKDKIDVPCTTSYIM